MSMTKEEVKEAFREAMARDYAYVPTKKELVRRGRGAIKHHTTVKPLLMRYRVLVAKNAQLKKELEEAKMYEHNYFRHIAWLKSGEEFKYHPKPCPKCGSENVGLDGSICCAKFFVWCLDCDAMGPDRNSENAAIHAWNEAEAEDLIVFDDEEGEGEDG